MNLQDIIEIERTALTTEFLYPVGLAQIQVPPYVAVPDFETLQRTPTILRAKHPISIAELPGAKPQHAVVQECKSLSYKFLWTHVDNNNYRADYLKFLQLHHGLKIQALPTELHVDHLYNRARARAMDLPFVRMVLLPRSINTSHGAGYEKSRTKGKIGTKGNQRGIDEIVLMKLWGVPSPSKNTPPTPQMLAHLGRISVLFNIPRAELERNVRTLMEVAAFRSAP